MLFYTGVGSRQTPENIQSLMRDIAHELAKKGYILRSGGADGADTAFHLGSIVDGFSNSEIYLPWNGFNCLNVGDRPEYINTPKLCDWKNAIGVLSKVRKVQYLRSSVLSLLTRNVFQVLGRDLKQPSSFVVCYAVPLGEKSFKGGTAIAIAIAQHYNIPVFNLYHPTEKERLEDFINRQSF